MTCPLTAGPVGRRLGALVIALSAATLVSACGGRLHADAPENPAALVDPTGASWVLVTPPLEEVRVAALQILVNVEGLLGVVDLLRESYEVDLGDEDLFANLGLAPDQPLVALGVEEGVCLILSARSGDPLDEIVERVGDTSGYRIERREAAQGLLSRVYDEERCVVALLRMDGLVLLGYGPDGRADAAVARVALHHLPDGAVGLEAPDGRFLFEWRGGVAAARPVDVSGLLGPLAGVGHWLHGIQAGIRTLRLTFAAGIDGIDWDLEMIPTRPEARGPSVTGTAVPDWKDAVPEDTILTLQIRSRFDGTFGELLGGKGMYILGLLAGEVLDPKRIPEIRQALEAMDAEVGLVLLGADPRAPVGEIIAPSSVLQALNAVHMGLIVQGTPPERFLEWIPVEDGPVAGGWRAHVVSAAAPRAVEFCKAKEDRSLCLGVLAGADRLMVLSGKGETDRVAKVWSGAAPALGKALFVGRTAGDMVLTVKMKRLVRDLRSKGVPPFYLRMVNSFLEIQAVRRDSPEGTRFEGEVLLR
ncbi:MAG: hypothetical protein ABIK09_00195 [Pseudomonadota bacterium]